MTRALTAGMIAALSGAVVRPVMFYEGEFSAGTLRLFTGYGTTQWNGQTWTGAGTVMRIGPAEETVDVRAVGFQVNVSGDLSAAIQIAIAECRQGLAGRVWLGCINDAGALIADPFKMFEGRLNTAEITEENDRTNITLSYESRYADITKTRERRFTTEDQRIDYANDSGFDGVPGLQDFEITWGRQ